MRILLKSFTNGNGIIFDFFTCVYRSMYSEEIINYYECDLTAVTKQCL